MNGRQLRYAVQSNEAWLVFETKTNIARYPM